MCRAGHRLEIQNICCPSVGYPVYSDESDRVGASGRWRLRDGGLWACGLAGLWASTISLVRSPLRRGLPGSDFSFSIHKRVQQLDVVFYNRVIFPPPEKTEDPWRIRHTEIPQEPLPPTVLIAFDPRQLSVGDFPFLFDRSAKCSRGDGLGRAGALPPSTLDRHGRTVSVTMYSTRCVRQGHHLL